MLSLNNSLAVLGAANGGTRPMSRQNFYQSRLAQAIPVERRIGRVRLYNPVVVGLWASWLRSRRGWIALGLLPSDTPLVPDDGRVPRWVESGEYEWDCPVCGGWAIGAPDPDDQRVWCPVDGVVAPSTGM